MTKYLVSVYEQITTDYIVEAGSVAEALELAGTDNQRSSQAGFVEHHEIDRFVREEMKDTPKEEVCQK